MFPMHKKSWKRLRDVNQPLKSKVSWPLPEPTKLITNPMGETEVKSTKDMPHLRLSESAIIIDPPSDFRC
jgi:hypothetical protein